MFKLWPNYKQYKKWSLPSKLTFIGTLLGIVSLLFTVATYFLSDEILDIIRSTPERVILSGIWEPEFNHPAFPQKLIIGMESSKHFRFRFDVRSGQKPCGVIGVATLTDIEGNAKYTHQKSKCEINFNISNNKSVFNILASEECSYFCAGLGGGGSGYFEGQYIKKKDYFVKKAVLSEVNSPLFSIMLGDWYELFYKSMFIINELEDLDHLGARVHGGTVRSSYTEVEAIIMETDSGKLWGAVINDNYVEYFTNHSDYENKLPKTIEKWMELFSDKEVIYHGAM